MVSSLSSIPRTKSFKFAAFFVAVPYLVGVLVSSNNLKQIEHFLAPFIDRILPLQTPVEDVRALSVQRDSVPDRVLDDESVQVVSNAMDVEACFKQLVIASDIEHFENLSVVLHRNGQAESCGGTISNVALEMKQILVRMQQESLSCPANEKYQVEALLTRLFHSLAPSCTSEDLNKSAEQRLKGFYSFCDMGQDKTPILLDHDRLVSIPFDGEEYLPCHFHNANGVRVTSLHSGSSALHSITEMAKTAVMPQPECDASEETCTAILSRELHLYAVPAGRVFMHIADYVGQIIDLPHVSGGDPTQPVYLEVLSTSPAVFDLHNFFTPDESQELVDRALKETRESHRVKRSSTGASGHNVNNHRTSESGFDTEGETSITVKKRCFDVLGFDSYVESNADGLQILRYNLTKAYIPHMDWIDGNDRLEHNYESGEQGGNRFATILLYMTDLGPDDGGETVFTEAWPTGQAVEDHVPIKTALEELRSSNRSNILEQDSWEETMVAKCRTRLAIRPHAGRAVLFYSQYPDGKPDPNSRHGGCPVLAGTKYAANLWVWNTARDGYPGNPKNPKYNNPKKDKSKAEEIPAGRVTAVFRNDESDSALDNAKLYYDSGDSQSFWGNLGKGDPPLSVHTYKSHKWVLKVGEEVVKSWTITSADPVDQEYVV